MITVSVTQLVDAIMEADVYSLPNMSSGTDYLYNSLYKRLSSGEDVRLSEIDYNSFELDDINSMRKKYDTLVTHKSKADSIANTLRELSPVVTAAAFV